MNTKKIALLTAGLGTENFSAAAERLISQSKALYDFSLKIVLTSSNFSDLCPSTAKIYRKSLDVGNPGYGFWSWKPELVYKVASGAFGAIDQVVWIDSGCELIANSLSKRVFQDRIATTFKDIGWFHALNSNDIQYSKELVIEKLPSIDRKLLEKPQIQANYFHLNALKSIELVEKWYKYSREINLMNLETKQEEDSSFKEHRSDQSLLSILAKSMSIPPNASNLPTGQTRVSKIRGIVHPVWVSRNRTGISIVPKFLEHFCNYI
jgi:hypothetical protein